MKYRKEIDGLRAIAVVTVLFFHADFDLFSGGFVGVDIFFVISGYLITTIILSEKEKGTFSLVNFYERRARRILPALFFVMLICLPFAWMWLSPSDMLDFSTSLIAVPTFVSNILFWQESGYFDATTELKPLLHTWSLAVEEQYYLLFPLFLMFMWRFKKRWILSSFMVIALLSLAAAQWGAYNSPTATFYLLITRGWELAIGAAIAFYFVYRKQEMRRLLAHKWADDLLAAFGLLLITYSVFVFDGFVPFPSLYALIPTIGTAMIIVFASSQTIVGRILSVRPIVGIGLISYSAYLWHQPLLAFARHRMWEFTETAAATMILGSLGLAYLSWRFVEKPFRHTETFGRPAIFTFAAAGSIFFIVIGIAGYYTDGFISRDSYQKLRVLNYEPDNRLLQTESWRNLRMLTKAKQNQVTDNPVNSNLLFDTNDPRKRLLIIGNSHSKDLYNVLLNSNTTSTEYQLARFGIQIWQIDETFFDTENYLIADTVVVATRYRKKDIKVLEDVVSSMLKDGKNVVLVKNIFEFKMYQGKKSTLTDKLVQQSFVIGESDVEEFVSMVNRQHYAQYIQGERDVELQLSDHKIEQLAKKFDKLKILDRMDYVCEEISEQCYAINHELDKYFFDYGHHTLKGAEFFGARVDQIGWLKNQNL